MFAEADKNKNGKIDFDEFIEMMLPSTIQAEILIRELFSFYLQFKF